MHFGTATVLSVLATAGCSWPRYGYEFENRGCATDMLACLRMGVSPTEQGWDASQAGTASFRVSSEEYQDNRTLRVESPGFETAPVSFSKLSWSPESSSPTGRVMFDFRLAEIGPYTRVTIVELDFGERALRFFLSNTVEQRSLSIQYVLADRSNILWEVAIPDQKFFQETRWLELEYFLLAGERRASAYIEGEPVVQDLVLGEDWLPTGPILHIGAFEHIYPTSEASFELDNVGFDDQPR